MRSRIARTCQIWFVYALVLELIEGNEAGPKEIYFSDDALSKKHECQPTGVPPHPYIQLKKMAGRDDFANGAVKDKPNHPSISNCLVDLAVCVRQR